MEECGRGIAWDSATNSGACKLSRYSIGALWIPACRQMVQGLHKLGLRVVLDVVYNHTFHSLMDGAPKIL